MSKLTSTRFLPANHMEICYIFLLRMGGHIVRRKIGLTAFIALALWICGTTHGGDLIALSPAAGGQSQLVLTANDATPNGQSLTEPLAIPKTNQISTTDGAASAGATYSLSGNELHLTLSQALDGHAQSSAQLSGFLTFIAKYDLHYAITGSYSVTSPSTMAAAFTQTVNFLGAGDINPNFRTNTSALATPGQTTTVSYPHPQTDSGAAANWQGTLARGSVSDLLFQNFVDSTAAASVTGATTTGNITLSLSLLGDMNGDGAVTLADLLGIARHYGQSGATYAMGDLNGDGVVDFHDVMILAHHYGQSSAAPAAAASLGTVSVPEPLALTLVAILAIGFVRTRFARRGPAGEHFAEVAIEKRSRAGRAETSAVEFRSCPQLPQ